MRDKGEENIAFLKCRALGWRFIRAKKIADELDGGKVATPQGFRDFTLAHNVASPQEVDETLNEAIAAGAALLKPGQKVFWGGYSGYFADPDGFLWEVAHNPFFNCLSWCKITLG